MHRQRRPAHWPQEDAARAWVPLITLRAMCQKNSLAVGHGMDEMIKLLVKDWELDQSAPELGNFDILKIKRHCACCDSLQNQSLYRFETPQTKIR